MQSLNCIYLIFPRQCAKMKQALNKINTDQHRCIISLINILFCIILSLKESGLFSDQDQDRP